MPPLEGEFWFRHENLLYLGRLMFFVSRTMPMQNTMSSSPDKNREYDEFLGSGSVTPTGRTEALSTTKCGVARILDRLKRLFIGRSGYGIGRAEPVENARVSDGVCP